MNAIPRVVLLALGLTLHFGVSTAAPSECTDAVRVRRSDEAIIRFDINARPIKRIDPSYFGFNIEWVGFQADLWNSETGSAHPDVVSWLKRLSGATYRYPGGTVANHFQWRSAIGRSRVPQKAVEWTGPIRMDFGVTEYFDFLTAVEGQAWLVANIYGEFGRERPIDHHASEAMDFANVVAKVSAKANKPIIRWELGNELDRGANRWSAEKYASNANAVAEAIRKPAPNTKFVALWPDYDAFPGVHAGEYARRVAALLGPGVTEFAQHMYFDGPPGGPPVTNRLVHMCKLIEAAHTQGSSPGIWVTEFARWPPGKATDPNWKLGFPLTANLASAISTADFLIGTTQIQEVRGGMIHSLSSSKGPWPMFHRHGDRFDPSAVLLSLVLLRQGLIGDVLPTEVASPYDAKTNNPLVRAVAVASPDKKTVWITMVNRGNSRTIVKLDAGRQAGLNGMGVTDVVAIHDETDLANNYAVADRVAIKRIDVPRINPRSDPMMTIDLLPNSISVLRFDSTLTDVRQGVSK